MNLYHFRPAPINKAVRLALAGILIALLAGYVSARVEASPRLGFTPVQTTTLPMVARDADSPPPVAVASEPTPVPDPWLEAVKAQLPTEMPARDEMGWPMHYLAAAVTWARAGETERATEWANAFWELRDPETGLWVNAMGYVDMANPFLATVLFTHVGQYDRAAETSANAIAFSRNRIDTQGVGAYNAHYLSLLTALVVGNEIPADQLELLAPGFLGYYSPLDTEPTLKGRYYSDIMIALRNELTGSSDPLLTDETEYCPTLKGSAECRAFYRWANGQPDIPDLAGEVYSFYNDGIFLYSRKGLGLP